MERGRGGFWRGQGEREKREIAKEEGREKTRLVAAATCLFGDVAIFLVVASLRGGKVAPLPPFSSSLFATRGLDRIFGLVRKACASGDGRERSRRGPALRARDDETV